MTRFRTHAEMDAVYQKRHQQGLSHPYILEYKHDNQLLIFFGSSHSNDPEDRQWQPLTESWQRFKDQKNHKKVLLYENQSADQAATVSYETAMQKWSESGVAVWLAHQSRVTAECGEPDRNEEIEHLKKSFSVPEIMTYYFGRQMQQWCTQDHKTNPDWENYASSTVALYGTLDVWDDYQITLENVLRWFTEQTKQEFNPKDKALFYALSDPTQSVISSASSQFRDIFLFDKIKGLWQSGHDVFIVYGSGHAIVLEPALEELVGKS